MRGFLGAALIAESPKIELRPAHDEIKPNGYGAPIRLPTTHHPKTGRRYPLCGPYLQPLGTDLADIILGVVWTDADLLREMASKTPPKVSELGDDYRPPQRRWTEESGSASEILMRLWGVARATPGRTVKCPAHPDDVPSLSVAYDDQRAWCHSPGCLLDNDGRGRGTYELQTLAPGR